MTKTLVDTRVVVLAALKQLKDMPSSPTILQCRKTLKRLMDKPDMITSAHAFILTYNRSADQQQATRNAEGHDYTARVLVVRTMQSIANRRDTTGLDF